jgi:hypothetical protein
MKSEEVYQSKRRIVKKSPRTKLVQRSKTVTVDVSDVPYHKPILKSENIGIFCDNSRNHTVNPELASKYVGVYYHKGTNKWRAQMMIENKVCNLGEYIDEEEAGSMYAKVAFKYKRQGPVATGIYGGLDLRNVPNQPLIKSEHTRSSSSSTNITKYKGIKLCKRRWQARLSRGGNVIHLGTFDTIEEAAQIYANAFYYLENNSKSEIKTTKISSNTIITSIKNKPKTTGKKTTKTTGNKKPKKKKSATTTTRIKTETIKSATTITTTRIKTETKRQQRTATKTAKSTGTMEYSFPAVPEPIPSTTGSFGWMKNVFLDTNTGTISPG